MLKNILYRLHADSLFRNSFYLMLATAVMAGFGFFFWLISARLVPPESIGVATALISVMNIVAIFSLIGFDSAIVRFLAHSTQRNDKLNTGIILVSIAALIIGGLFVLLVPMISPRLAFIRENPFTAIAFMLFCAMSAINILTDSVFLAYRETKYSLIINTIFSFIKMLLPLLFVVWGAFGIFSAAAIGQSMGFILSIGVMVWKFDYRPRFVINRDVLKQVWHYCAANYFAGALNLLPIALLPVIITNHLGSTEAAYFYIVMMMGNLLYIVPQATTKSLFAEGSHDEKTISINIKKSLRIVGAFLIPGIIALVVAGGPILQIFGEGYSSGGLNFLYLIAISGIAVGAYSLCNSLFRIEKYLRALIATNLFYMGTIVGLSYLFLPLGLVGIGYAWLLGNSMTSILGFILFTHYRRAARAVA